MTARWDALPPKAKVKEPRRAVLRGVWRCKTCDEVIAGTWASAERHADGHGGASLECVL